MENVWNNYFQTYARIFFKKENSILWQHQFGFRSFDSCQSQLLSIVYGIYTNFDQNPILEVRANFLDISKAFEKVWHEGLIS